MLTADPAPATRAAPRSPARAPIRPYPPVRVREQFAIQPKLEAAAPRPRDYLIVVDTSASQAGSALAAARQLSRALIEGAGKDHSTKGGSRDERKPATGMASGGHLKEDDGKNNKNDKNRDAVFGLDRRLNFRLAQAVDLQ